MPGGVRGLDAAHQGVLDRAQLRFEIGFHQAHGAPQDEGAGLEARIPLHDQRLQAGRVAQQRGDGRAQRIVVARVHVQRGLRLLAQGLERLADGQDRTLVVVVLGKDRPHRVDDHAHQLRFDFRHVGVPAGDGLQHEPGGLLGRGLRTVLADASGLFQGADHGLLRLSVTGDPADRGFAPGLAWKAFVDGKPSENVSALYTLSGQGTNYNFFANEMSNYVSTEANETLGTTILFSAVSTKPTLLRMNDMAKVKQNGSTVSAAKAPTQVYFVPRPEVKTRFATTAHDFRHDLATLGAGSKLYDVYATSMEIKTSIIPSINKSYATQRRSSAVKIGEMELTSPLIVSAFGDGGVFFKHQRHEDI